MYFASKSVSMNIQLMFYIISIILLTFIETTVSPYNHVSFSC
jgi:hypothetical protein